MRRLNKMKTFILFTICLSVTLNVVDCENATNVQSDFSDDIIEEGRTLIHNTLKRFMVIAPAIFFKLGIAFTLLLIVTLVAANNGFIGFLILVVGLSTVLSRFQSRPTPIIQPAPAALPVSFASFPQYAQQYAHQYGHHHHHPWIDRSDNAETLQKASKTVNGYYGVQQDNFDNNFNYDSNADTRNTGVYYKNRFTASPYSTQ
ncbi:hypothetical protein RN001_006364 [Aquatica leii]|uniref:Uncharacterized protein n=1 Tax=Aquatica leii TaxID=1421715 RepID=A0AAN7P7V7_9COLE|nr:hypothetical protein RN001_006364 [Aquatica leii]